MAVKPNSRYWDDRAKARLTKAERNSEKHIAKVKKAYDKGQRNIQKEIDDIYRKYGTKTGLDKRAIQTLLSKGETDRFWQTMEGKGLSEYVLKNYKSRITRLEKLQAQLYEKSKEIALDEYNISTPGYRDAIYDAYNHTIFDTQTGSGLGFGFDTLDARGIDTILNHNWSGKHYSTRIWHNTDLLADTLSEILSGAFMSGQSKAKTSKELREAMNVSKNQAERLIRTETNYFNNHTEAVAYEEMGVKEYVYIGTLDNRTSEICQDLDQKRFKFNKRQVGVNYPPMHPNCRSTTRAWLGKEYEPLQRRARDPETGKTSLIKNMPYSEWAKINGIATKTPTVEVKAVNPKDIPKEVKTAPETPKKDLDFRKDISKISLTGIDKEYQEVVKETFNEVYNKYPIDISNMVIDTGVPKDALGFAQIGVSGKRNRTTREYTITFSERIRLHKKYHVNEKSSEHYHNLTTKQFGKKYKGHGGTIWHEYGHQIEYQYNLRNNPEEWKWARTLQKGKIADVEDIKQANDFNRLLVRTEDSMSHKIYDDLYNVMKKGDKNYTDDMFTEQIAKSFGRYATTDHAEFLAEGFTSMNLIDPDLQDQFTKDFKKIFDKYYAEIGGHEK